MNWRVSVSLDVAKELVPEGDEVPCDQSAGFGRCCAPATAWYVVGNHKCATCDDEEHTETAQKEAVQAYVNEIMMSQGHARPVM